MEDCIVLVDYGFFKLVKKEFEIKTGKQKKLLQTFENNRKGKFHKSNHLIDSCTRYKKLKPGDME